MSRVTIYLTDDIMRPDNGNGFPVIPSSTDVSLTVNGRSLRWYSNWYIYYFDDATNASGMGTTLTLSTKVFGRSSSGGSLPVRVVAQLSENNFSSIKSEVITELGPGYGYPGGGFYVYSRKYPDNNSHATKINDDTTGTYTYSFSGYNSFDLISLSVSNKQIWVRSKVQYKNSSGTWVDCSRSSGLGVWKTYTTYAPFYQTVTAPAHFYANALNQFGASIGAKFTSEITDVYGYVSNSYQWVLRESKIVRNENPPYITSGTATNYLYFPPFVSVNTSLEKPTKYYFTLSLKVIDPSDSNYMIVVSKRTISGNIEFKSSDDITGLYGTPTWSVSDPSGMYEQYGVLLRNVATKLNYTVHASAKYGAAIYARYRTPGTGYVTKDFILNELYYGESEIGIPATGTNASIGVRVNGFGDSVILDDSITVPIIQYSAPSLPSVSIHRCESDGSPNDMGAYCRIDWAVSITSINNQNAKKLVINHPGGTTIYDPLSSYTQSGSLVVAANPESSYTIVITVSDSLNSYSRNLRLSTANVTMDWLYNGKGIGFGTVATKENAVEIAENWNLFFNAIDMKQWMKQMLFRMDAIEQFANNVGSTNQFPVTFYNDNELLKKQWVQLNQYATPPAEVPEKEPTTTAVFTFSGWTIGQIYVDPATRKITSATNFKAAFSSATRKYSVLWYNGSTLLETDDNLNYHANAGYNGTAPTRAGYTFAGWMPSGRYIESSESALAQFFQDAEIQDSWEEIMFAVDNGTAKSKYKPGNWKTLTTSNGNYRIRIMGFGVYELANSKAKAKIFWRSIDAIRSRMMNPALQYETQETTIPDWTAENGTNLVTFTSGTKAKRSATYPGTVTTKITTKGSGTFKIGYKYTYYTGTLVIKVNGETVYSGNGESTAMTYLEYPCSNGTVFNIELQSYYSSPSAYNEYIDTKVVELNWASVTNGATRTNTVISSRIKTSIARYVSGTGCVGGWKECQMRAWMNGDFFDGINPIVRNKIKSVKIHSQSMVADETASNKYVNVPDEVTQDKVFLVSYSEMYGNESAEYGGIDWNMSNTSYRPSSLFYRSTNTSGKAVVLTQADATHEPNGVYAPTRFRNSNGSDSDYIYNTYYYFGFCT